jgi:hypothetical protein
VYDLEDFSRPRTQIRTLSITQHVGEHELTVYATEFVPLPVDRLSYNWTDDKGQKQSMYMPCFCLTQIPKVTINIFQYITKARSHYIELLKESDPLARDTIFAAMQLAQKRVVS